jgi:hypothetical protein
MPTADTEPGGPVSSVGTRAYVASHFALELDGKDGLGFVRSVEGGGIKADVLTYQSGHVPDLWRQVGKPKFEDITFQVGMGMSDAFYDWIANFSRRHALRQSGAVVGADFNYYERTRREFANALISEIQIPTLDGGDKNPCYMTVKVVPEQMTYKAGDGKRLAVPDNKKASNKKWLAANFRLELSGALKDATKRILRVDGFTIKQQVIDYPSGNTRFPIKVPGRMEFPNLVIYVPSVDVRPFETYLAKRMHKGDRSDALLDGAIVFLGSDVDEELFRITLKGVDVHGMEQEKFDASAEAIARTKISLQVEAMEFPTSAKGTI